MSREKTAVFSPLLACKFYHAGDFFARGFMDLKCRCNIKEGLILQSPLRGSWIRGILHYYKAGLVPAACFFDLQSAIFPRGRYEDALASSTEPCGGDVLAVRLLSGLVPIALGHFSLV